MDGVWQPAHKWGADEIILHMYLYYYCCCYYYYYHHHLSTYKVLPTPIIYTQTHRLLISKTIKAKEDSNIKNKSDDSEPGYPISKRPYQTERKLPTIR
jgi:hypothetical protein